MQHKYFIFDCQNNIVGNHKGYPTMRGANIGLSKIKFKLWARYDELKAAGAIKHNMIYNIVLMPTITQP